MIKKYALLVTLFSTFALNVAANPVMQQRHAQKGIACASCHKTATPVKAPKKATCSQCHQYEDMRQRTAKVTPNPHDSHAGEVSCMSCHKEHKPSVNFCQECHPDGFKFKVP